jgi:hypothetical protein
MPPGCFPRRNSHVSSFCKKFFSRKYVMELNFFEFSFPISKLNVSSNRKVQKIQMSLQISKLWKYKCLIKSQISEDQNTNSKSFSPHFAKSFSPESMWSLFCNFRHYANFITLCTLAYVQACECPISFKNRAVNNTGNYVMWWNSINVEELQA